MVALVNHSTRRLRLVLFVLDTRPLWPRQKSVVVDTSIPFHEAKLFKEEEGRRVNTFYRRLSLLDPG
jgi:hypothetical protein